MIRVDVRNAERIKQIFENTSKEAKIILWHALNRAATAGKTRASVEIRKTYVIKAGDVKKRIKIRRASASNLTAQLRASGPMKPLMEFNVSPSLPDKMRVRANVKKGPMKPIENGFVTRMSNGHVNVFVRAGESRLPIKGLYGPSIAQMLGNEKVYENVINRAQTVLNGRLEHEIERLLRGEF